MNFAIKYENMSAYDQEIPEPHTADQPTHFWQGHLSVFSADTKSRMCIHLLRLGEIVAKCISLERNYS